MIAIQDTTFALEPWGCVSQLSYGPSTQSHNPTEKKSPAKKKSLSAVKILPTQITWHLCNGGYR